MTRYVIDQARNTLLASWSTGRGDIAITVAGLPAAASGQDTLALAESLNELSQACWRCYIHPPGAAVSHGLNSEGDRRQSERDAFEAVVPAVTTPNLPSDGYLVQSSVHVEEAAHHVGRILHGLGSPELTAQVAADVAAELAAIEQAERGDLSDRARQAVALSREDASPVQVAQADVILHDNPFGTRALFTEVDPAAAAVAAAHWLYAAAVIAATYTGLPPERMVSEADNIEALPHESPTKVLELLAAGTSPRQAVMPLIHDALLIAEGRIPRIAELKQRIAAAEELLAKWRADSPALSLDAMGLRLTTLNPARPAPDLLEDLLSGIRGCWLLYQEHAVDHMDEADEDSHERLTQAFFAEVREEAAAHGDRLL